MHLLRHLPLLALQQVRVTLVEPLLRTIIWLQSLARTFHLRLHLNCGGNLDTCFRERYDSYVSVTDIRAFSRLTNF